MPIRQILTPRMVRMLSVFGWTVTVCFSLSALFPLYLFTPVGLGGMDYSPPEIAQVGAASGLSQALWLLFAMPRLDAALGTRKLFLGTSSIYPFVMALPILANAFARSGATAGSLAMLAIYVIIGQAVNMTFSESSLSVRGGYNV